MVCKVLSAIDAHNMIASGDSVIVALSGGADSMTLLSVLLSLRDKLQIDISAAHVNHCLRGDESDRDEAFVRETCKKLGVRLHMLRTDVAGEAEKTGEGTEECGRRIRYEFFYSISDTAKIATAHTLSDNLETVLFNLTRGSGLNGLCGIPPVRGRLIRPLISCTRGEIENYCADNAISFVTDSTNAHNDYTRNKIRNLVVPQLRLINPSVEASVGRCIESLSEDESFLSDYAAKLMKKADIGGKYSVDTFLSEAPPIRKRAINRLLREKMIENPQKHHIDLIEKALHEGGCVQTAPDVTVEVRNGVLSFKSTVQVASEWQVAFLPGSVKFPYGEIKTEIINKSVLNNIQKVNKNILANCLDCDKIVGNAFFRSRLSGDRLSQASGECTKTLKKLFNELKIPVDRRNAVVVLSDENGALWVEGYGCDRRAAITGETERILVINVTH